jgi:hypothetical protein
MQLQDPHQAVIEQRVGHVLEEKPVAIGHQVQLVLSKVGE